MAEQQEREQSWKTTQQPKVDWDEHTRAAGNREGIPQEEAENTPPGGDAQTIYSNDREPGEVEPQRQQP